MEETQVLGGGGGGGRRRGQRSDERLSWEAKGENQSFRIPKTTTTAVWPHEGISIECKETEGLKSTKDMSVISRLKRVEGKRGSGTKDG